MPKIEWSDDLKVGLELIDNDHQDSIRHYNAALEAGDDALPSLFAVFVEHLKEHFGRENALMEEYGFPSIAIHKGEHLRVIGELETISAEIEKGDFTMARRYLEDVVPGWFMEHLGSMDSATASFVIQVIKAQVSL